MVKNLRCHRVMRGYQRALGQWDYLALFLSASPRGRVRQQRPLRAIWPMQPTPPALETGMQFNIVILYSLV